MVNKDEYIYIEAAAEHGDSARRNARLHHRTPPRRRAETAAIDGLVSS